MLCLYKTLLYYTQAICMLSFTIVTIVRDGQNFILETLESVSNQSYEHINHIIIDGNSSDSTINIIKLFNHSKKYNLYNQKGTGISGAFNEGIINSSGDLVLFLNAGDTLVDNEVITTIVDSYNTHNWQWAFGETISVSRRRIIKRHVKQYSEWSNRFLLYGNPICHQSAIFTRSLLEQVGLYNEELDIEMDYDFNIRSALVVKPFLLNFLVSYYDTTGISSVKVFYYCKMYRHVRDIYFPMPLRDKVILDVSCYVKAIFRMLMIPVKLYL